MSGGEPRQRRFEGSLANSGSGRASAAASPAPLAVALDARMAFHSGIGRYIRSLGAALQRQDPALDLRLMAPPDRQEFRDLLPGTGRIAYAAGIYTLREQLEGSWVCRRTAGAAVFHFPHYNVPWRLPTPSVVTIHDLTHLEWSVFFPPARVRLAALALGRAVRRAARLIAVSEATRAALERAFPGAAERTDVVHHGVDRIFAPPVGDAAERLRRREGLGRFFLYVGNDKPHKNLDLLVRAFRRVQARQPDVALVLISDAPPGRYAPARVVPHQEDAALAIWYGAAEALLLPSLNEGFGLTALEAAACGTPVVASDIPVFRETLGDAAILVDPADEAAWADALSRLASEPAHAAGHRLLGPRRAAAFTWEAAAQQTLAIYRRVAGKER